MKRKVIKQGNDTLTITLPKKWVERNKVKAGQEIDVEEKENTLVVGTTDFKTTNKINVNIKSFRHIGRRYLTALYRLGYDEVELTYSDPSYYQDIQQVISKHILGFEVIGNSKNSCIVKDFSTGEKKDFDIMLRRNWLIILENAKDTLFFIEQNDFHSLEQIPLRDHSVNKITNYCLRILPNTFDTPKKQIVYYNYIRLLEQTADEYQYLAKHISENKIKTNKQNIKILKKINDQLYLFYKLFYKFELENGEKILDMTNEICDEIICSMEQKNADAVLLHHLYNISQRIRKSIFSVIEISLLQNNV